MKKLIYFLIFFPSLIFAQNQNDERKFNFNFKAGVVLSDASTDKAYIDNENITKNKTSFYLGAGFEYFISKMFSTNIGLEYLTTGSEKTGNNFEKIDFSQIKIPLTIKAKLFKGLYLEGGSYVSFITNMDTKDYSGEINPNYIENENIDYGVLFGLGYNYNDFFIEANINIGFVDLINYNENNFGPEFDPIIDAGESDPEFKNKYFQVGVGYKF
ncbi:PorT family protein [Flavobacterium salilacus subsp. salilacus]|uniref:outer membrane beta-barrel protein n=1 Tax=Flavobacterium TaxID=237 RepID=UPI0010752960|nr:MULTISPECIES: outer membrane beta-barrel protein [Flavobacterium]KAF2519952.1 PorT family protein [Flavobacterium salilacus subsp. salilacus]MBE1614137.1 PorT family protein [Flavobacterium sp. SaA2.13]